MPPALLLVCTAELVGGVCPSESQAWVSVPDALAPADLGIDPAGIATVYAWGFGAVFSLWLVGYAIGIATGLIKRA